MLEMEKLVGSASRDTKELTLYETSLQRGRQLHSSILNFSG